MNRNNFRNKKIHFVGIGGIGMSAIARFLFFYGAQISGSDKLSSKLTDELICEGIKDIWIPHSKEKIEKLNPEIIVYSTAIKSTENEELKWATENGKMILHRSELLELISEEKKIIAISGTHGKTTTTSMTAEMLYKCKTNASAIVGGLLFLNGKNCLTGNGDLFVIEADESDKSFLKGKHDLGVITNIEPDHLENYNGSFENIKKSFLEFSTKLIQNKGVIACFEDKVTRKLILENFGENHEKIHSYGFFDSSVNKKYYIKEENGKAKIFYLDNYLGEFKLKVPGKHNILNALATFIVGHQYGLNPKDIITALESYSGVQRRFQYIHQEENLNIVDDYAHHPTEITTTIKAAKELNPNRLIIIVQPHHPLRLKDLWNEFKECFLNIEDETYICDTYVARGGEIEGVTSEKLVQEINKENIHYMPGSVDEIKKALLPKIQKKDFLLIMGAGDITNLAYKLHDDFSILKT